jgi:type IX secretion system substrate protein
MQVRTIFFFLVGGLFLLIHSSALATHCQIHGRVLRGTTNGTTLAGIQLLKTPIENLGMDTVYTDSIGNYAFTHLPGDQTYTITVNPPPVYLSIDAVPGHGTQAGDLGEVSFELRVSSSELSVWVKNGCVSSDNLFLIASAGDTVTYRSFVPDDLIPRPDGKLLKPVKRGKGMPNASNLLWEVVTFGGFAPGTSQSDQAGGMRVGYSYMVETAPDRWKPDPVLDNNYSWVRLTKWNFKSEMGKNFADLQTTLEDRTGEHTAKPRGLDSSFMKGVPKRPMFGEKKKLPPAKQNNRLFADLVALKVGIASSELEQTPYGFGDLVYDGDNSLKGLSILEIAARADSALTFWASGTWDFGLLDEVIAGINTTFHGEITSEDTLSFVNGDKLVLKGTAPVYKSPVLSAPGNPTRRPNPKIRPKIGVDAQPGEFTLNQNYPNPFNPTTTIDFELGGQSYVTLKVFNILGQEVMTLLDHEQIEGGTQEIAVDGTGLTSGVYFYRLTVEDPVTGSLKFQSLKKMVLLK